MKNKADRKQQKELNIQPGMIYTYKSVMNKHRKPIIYLILSSYIDNDGDLMFREIDITQLNNVDTESLAPYSWFKAHLLGEEADNGLIFLCGNPYMGKFEDDEK